jgi:hypothetical protein
MAELATNRRMLSIAQMPESEPKPEGVTLDHDSSPPIRSGEWRASWGFRLLSLAPLGALAFSIVAAPSYAGVMFSPPPDIVGLPLAFVLTALSVAIGLLGSTVVWLARSPRVAYVAFLLCTLPATFAAMTTPSLIMLMKNVRI